MKEKALFNGQLKGTDDEDSSFAASEGWLHNWKKRYNIRELNICGEKLLAEVAIGELEKFKRKLHQYIDRHSLIGDQIYNYDEMGLYYHMLPSKTLASRQEKSAPGYKKRVTTGIHKLKLVVIGKSVTPRIFLRKKIDKMSLPVWYTCQKSAWITSDIFSTYLHRDLLSV